MGCVVALARGVRKRTGSVAMATLVTPYVGTSLVFAALTNLGSTLAVTLEALGCEPTTAAPRTAAARGLAGRRAQRLLGAT